MDEATAQTNPLELCTKLMDAAVAGGAKVVIGKVEGVQRVDGNVLSPSLPHLQPGRVSCLW